VLRVTLTTDATQLYRQQQAAHPQAVRNLTNSADDLFVLPDLQNGTRAQFNADLFADYTNDGGGATATDREAEGSISRPFLAQSTDSPIPGPIRELGHSRSVSSWAWSGGPMPISARWAAGQRRNELL
jgi:hypothetical protein